MLPVFSSEHTSTKDKIIGILATSPNINTKKINSILKKQYALNVTYQAVHKTLKQMVEQGMVEYDGKNYGIDKQWVEGLILFLKNVKKTPESVQNFKITKISDDLETIEFDSLPEAELQFHKFREEYFGNIDKYELHERILCIQAPHLMVALMSPTSEYEFM
ncbi:hypothetical protein HOK76_08580, partial [archaeon]|nr:hypothetical protein [archaeon]